MLSINVRIYDKLMALWGAFFLSFFYVPYDSIWLEVELSFWNVPFFLMLPLFGLFVGFPVLKRKNELLPILFFSSFCLFYSLSVFWSSAITYEATLASLFFSLMVFSGFVVLLSKRVRFWKFLEYTVFIYVFQFFVFLLLYGLSNPRMYGIVSDINPAFVGLCSGFVLIVSVDQLLTGYFSSKLKFALFILAAISSITTIIVTQSRMVIVAILIVFLSCAVIKLFVWSLTASIREALFCKLLFFSLLALFPLALSFYFSEYIASRLSRLAALFDYLIGRENSSGPSPDAGRIDIWLGAIKNLEAPFWGHGFRSLYSDNGITAHNVYLTLFYELGLLGALAFLMAFLFAIFRSHSVKGIVFFGYLFLYGLGNDSIFMPFFWIFFAFFMAYFWGDRSEKCRGSECFAS